MLRSVSLINMLMMVGDMCISNESVGKLEVVEKKEHSPEDCRVGKVVDENHIKQDQCKTCLCDYCF